MKYLNLEINEQDILEMNIEYFSTEENLEKRILSITEIEVHEG